MPISKLSVCQVCAVDFTYHKFLQPLCSSLAKEGFDVHVAFSPPSVDDELPNHWLKSLRFPYHPVQISRSTSPLSLLRSTFSLYRLFSAYNFHIVHVHTPVASIAARIAALFARTPIVLYTAHGFYFHDRMHFALRIFHISIEFLLSRLTTALLTQSSEDALTAYRLRFKNRPYIHFIGNGVCASRFFPVSPAHSCSIRSSLGLPCNSVVVGIVARLVLEKGYLDLLDAFHSLSPLHPNVYLLISGSRLDSDHSSSVEDAIISSQQKFPGKIVATGHTNNVEDIYRAMDIFCLPSYREGMPRTIIEAMMSSLPVVATDIRGCREEVVETVTGFIVPPSSPRELSLALASLINNKPLRQKLGANGRSRALELYDENIVLSKQIKIYRSLTRDF